MPHRLKPHRHDLRRLFIVEPGLSSLAGHPVECVLSLQAAADSLGIVPHVLSPQAASPEVLSGIRSVHRLLAAPCFPITEDGPLKFAESLERLAESHTLDRHDLVLLTSCHINELEGLAYFLRGRGEPRTLPPIGLTFHQLFPPAIVSTTVHNPEYQSVWRRRLEKAFQQLPSHLAAVSYWTAPCAALAAAYRTTADRHFGTLPFPITIHKSAAAVRRRQQSTPLTFAFLGDGRQEKGLVLLLRAILRTEQSGSRRFLLQHVNPRGFDSTDRELLDELIARARARTDVELLERALTPAEFHSLLDATDVVVIPYDPRQYEIRASMLFVLSAMHGIPVIVSDGTWMAREMREGNADGLICRYDRHDSEETVSALHDALGRMQLQWRNHHARSLAAQHKYRRHHTPERHLQAIMDHHRRVPL